MRHPILKSTALVAAMFGSTVAQANLLFDPDGSGGAAVETITSFDWAPGNGVSVGGNLSDAAVGDTFDSYALSHGRLGTLLDAGGPITGGGGGDLPFEITYVTSIPETVRVLSPQSVGFSTFGTFSGADPDPTKNFFEIYADATGNSPNSGGGESSNDLAGTGFNDGRLILQGTISQVTSGGYITTTEFVDDGQGNVIEVPVIEDLDQYEGDSLGGQQTIVGSGSTAFDVTVDINFVDMDFFPGGLEELLLSFNTDVATPFLNVDPSAQFIETASTAGIGNPGDGSTFNPVLGDINGGLVPNGSGIQGVDFQFEVDARSPVDASYVPEPGTLALLSMGLLGFGSRRFLKG